jgi:hypothetical protein
MEHGSERPSCRTLWWPDAISPPGERKRLYIRWQGVCVGFMDGEAVVDIEKGKVLI